MSGEGLTFGPPPNIYTMVTPLSVQQRAQRKHTFLDCMKNRMQKKEVQHSSTKKEKKHKCYVYLKSFLIISMVELDHRRSAAKTLVKNEIKYLCYLKSFIIAGFVIF